MRLKICSLLLCFMALNSARVEIQAENSALNISNSETFQKLHSSSVRSKINKKSRYTIRAQDLGREGYVIRKPGTYTLAEDVIFHPRNPAKFVPVKFKGGGGSGAKGFALVSDGVVRGVAITHQGTNYTSPPKAIFGGKGEGAAALGGFSIASINIDAAGSNYDFPIVIISGDGQGAQAIVTSLDTFGGINGIAITNPGVGYTTAIATIVDDSATGSGATVSVNLALGSITGAVVSAGGHEYKNTVQAAITIKSSDVNLQLNGHLLAQAKRKKSSSIPNYSGINKPSKQAPYVVGILVPDPLPNSSDVNAVGYESIVISGDKATIDGFSLFGVRVLGHTSNIQISNVSIQNNGLLASYYLRPFPAYTPNGNPGYISLNYGDFFTQTPGTTSGTEFGVAGLCIGESDSLGMGPQFFTQKTSSSALLPYNGTAQNRVSFVKLNNVNCLNNYSFGLCINNVTDLSIHDSHFDGTLADDPQLWAIGGAFGSTEIPGEFPSILNGVITNSSFNNVSFIGDFTTEAGFGPLPNISGSVAGNLLTLSQNISFYKCTFNHISSTFAADQLFFGVDQQLFGSLNISIFDTSYDHCQFQDMNGLLSSSGWGSLTGDQFANFSPISENVTLSNFIISNVQTNGQNQLPAPVFGVSACGILSDFGINNWTIKNGVISDIITNGPAEVAVGIEIGQANNVLISHCDIQRVVTNQGGVVIGMDIFSSDSGTVSANNIVIDHCTLQDCETVTPTLPFSAPPYNQVRDVAKGFQISAQSAGLSPVLITNCLALHVKGTPTLNGNFSAGFRLRGSDPDQSLKCVIENCEALDNVYGFILINTSQCVVRNCRADFNTSDDGTNTGEGFTDIGTGTLAAPGQSFSLFQLNNAYGNGNGTTHTGVNGNYNINVDGAGNPPPLLEGQVSNPLSYTYFAPPLPAAPTGLELPNIRNVSLIP